jgi:hypothetical protein
MRASDPGMFCALYVASWSSTPYSKSRLFDEIDAALIPRPTSVKLPCQFSQLPTPLLSRHLFSQTTSPTYSIQQPTHYYRKQALSSPLSPHTPHTWQHRSPSPYLPTLNFFLVLLTQVTYTITTCSNSHPAIENRPLSSPLSPHLLHQTSSHHIIVASSDNKNMHRAQG